MNRNTIPVRSPPPATPPSPRAQNNQRDPDLNDNEPRKKEPQRSQSLEDTRHKGPRYTFFKIEPGRRNSLPPEQPQYNGPKFIFYKIEPSNERVPDEEKAPYDGPRFKVFKIEKSDEPIQNREPTPEPAKEHKKFKIFKIEKGRATPPIQKEPTNEVFPITDKKPSTPLPSKRWIFLISKFKSVF